MIIDEIKFQLILIRSSGLFYILLTAFNCLSQTFYNGDISEKCILFFFII